MYLKETLGAAGIGVLFIGGSFIAGAYGDAVRAWLDIGSMGIVLYLLLAMFATVIAPISALPFLPFAVSLWGPFAAAIASIIGWFAGALVAFWVARALGKPFVERIMNLKTLVRYEHALGGNYIFWNLVLLRMAVPVDILSYAVGLFSSVGFKVYALATLVGITPFAFILSYAAGASFSLQIGAVLAAVLAFFLVALKVRRANTTS